jgi:hypothetical protein
MGGLNHIAALFGVAAAISWIMVALSVVQTANLPLEMPSHQTVAAAAGPGTGGMPVIPPPGTRGGESEINPK